MNNQAAHTMPEPVTASMCPSSDYANGWNDCLAALSQTAGVPDGWRSFPYSAAWCDGLIATLQECGEHTAAKQIAEIKELAAAPAASGGEDGWQRMTAEARSIQMRHLDDHHGDVYHAMQSLVVKHGYRSTGPMTQPIATAPSSASVSERARELLAAEYSKCGMQQCAADIRSGVFAAAQQLAVNAIKAALEQKVPSGEVAIVCDWKDADPFPTFIEAEIGGKSVSLEWRDRPDGLKELIVPVTDSALRAIEQALTQQRGEVEDEDYHVIMSMGRLLAEIAVILKGAEPAGTAWSYHDLPELVKSAVENAHDIASEMRAWAAVKMRERGSSRRDKMMVEEWSKRLLALPEVAFPVKDFDIPGLSITKEEIRFAIRKVVADRVFIGQDFEVTTPQPSADAVRELVKRWRDESQLPLLPEAAYAQARVCARELESLLSGGPHA